MFTVVPFWLRYLPWDPFRGMDIWQHRLAFCIWPNPMGQQQCESNRMKGHHQSYIFRSIQRIQIQLIHHQKRQQESWMDWTWQPRVMKASFFSISVWKRYLQYLLYDFTKQCHCKLFSQKNEFSRFCQFDQIELWLEEGRNNHALRLMTHFIIKQKDWSEPLLHHWTKPWLLCLFAYCDKSSKHLRSGEISKILLEWVFQWSCK